MKIRPTAFVLLFFAFAALLLAAGCDRFDTPAPQTAEVDEPGYRRGKELERQGRESEAILEFNKVLAKRGLDNAPETNLELGILNQRLDPFAAVFYFQKYLKWRVSAERDDLVRQRIEVAKRDYISTLPGRPTLDTAATAAGGDLLELNNRLLTLQDENRRLRDENRRLRDAQAAAPAGNTAAANPILSSAPPAGIGIATQPFSTAGGAGGNTGSGQTQAGRVQSQAWQQQSLAQQQQSAAQQQAAWQQQALAQQQSAAQQQASAWQQAQQQPTQQQLQQTRPQQQTQPAQPAQQTQPSRATDRAYVVKRGDNLFGIARQFYGTASNAQIEAIVKANRGILTSGRDTTLREGMVLKLP